MKIEVEGDILYNMKKHEPYLNIDFKLNIDYK